MNRTASRNPLISWLIAVAMLLQGSVTTGTLLHCELPDGRSVVEVGCDHGHCDGSAEAAPAPAGADACLAGDRGCDDESLGTLSAVTGSRNLLIESELDGSPCCAMFDQSLAAVARARAVASPTDEPFAAMAKLLRPLRTIVLLI